MGIIIPFCQTAREQMDNDNVPFAMYPDPDAEADFIAEVTDYVTQSAEVDFNNFIEEMRTAVAHVDANADPMHPHIDHNNGLEAWREGAAARGSRRCFVSG